MKRLTLKKYKPTNVKYLEVKDMTSTTCSQIVKKFKTCKHTGSGGRAERESTTKPIGQNVN